MPRIPRISTRRLLSAAARARSAAAAGRSAARGRAVTGCPLAALARKYSKIINASKPWTWKMLGNPTPSQQSKIRDLARLKKLVPIIKVNAKGFPKFPKKFIKADHKRLPKALWKAKDPKQFKWLNDDLAKRNKNYDPDTQTFKNDPKKKKYTWHHHQDSGRMQLVEFGAHSSTSHNGGRTTWSKGPRK